jgi:hypothetical protein
MENDHNVLQDEEHDLVDHQPRPDGLHELYIANWCKVILSNVQKYWNIEMQESAKFKFHFEDFGWHKDDRNTQDIGKNEVEQKEFFYYYKIIILNEFFNLEIIVVDRAEYFQEF